MKCVFQSQLQLKTIFLTFLFHFSETILLQKFMKTHYIIVHLGSEKNKSSLHVKKTIFRILFSFDSFLLSSYNLEWFYFANKDKHQPILNIINFQILDINKWATKIKTIKVLHYKTKMGLQHRCTCTNPKIFNNSNKY